MQPASTDGTAALRVRLFGPPALCWHGGERLLAPRRPHQLLALLACRPQGFARAELAELFWPERPEGVARANLRVLIQRVQQGPVQLDMQAERVRWVVNSDLARFERAVAEGRDDEAIDGYRPPLLEGLEPGLPEPLLEWLDHERQRLDAVWRGLVQRRAAAAPPDRAESLAAWLEQAQPGAAAAEARLAAAAGRADPDAFIGRRAERAELARRLLAGSRAVVVLGPGGIGKSALLRAALAELGPAHFDGHAALVTLTDLSDAAQVPARIARALSLTLKSSGSAWPQLQAAIGRPGPWLLMLDNAEHLASLDEPLAGLLQACPGLRLVLGTRRRPALEAVLLPLEGLPLPDDDDGDDDDEETDDDRDGGTHGDPLGSLRRFDAVRLFEARARAASPGFVLAPPHAALHAVLRATEGLPLALELAAAATRFMPLADVAAELGRSMAVLDSASPGGRGLQACFERSWALLDEAGQLALQRLAWLPGAFSRAMAAAVAQVPLAGLASLVDRSLLRADRQGRLSLHPLLRQFVQAQHPCADEPQLAARHAEFVDHLLAGVEAPPRSASPETLRMLDDELPHIRAAWAWTVAASPPQAATRLARLARQMGQYHVERGSVAEVLPWLEQAVAQIQLPGRAGLAARAVTLRTLAMLHYHRGALALAQQQARQALRWAGQAGDTSTALGCLTVLGNALCFAGEVAAARPHFERAHRLARARGELRVAAAACNGLGLVERGLGHYDAALAHFLEGGRIAAEMGQASGQVVALINAGNVLGVLQRWDESRQLIEAALAQSEATGLVGKRAILHTMLAEIAHETGRQADARRHIGLALASLASGIDSVVPTQLRLVLAGIELAEGRLEAAAAALRDGLVAARDSGSTTMQLSAINAAADQWAARGAPDEAGRLWQAVLGHAAATPSLRDRAERGLATLAQLPPPPPAVELPVLLDALLQRVQAQLAGAAPVLKRS